MVGLRPLPSLVQVKVDSDLAMEPAWPLQNYVLSFEQHMKPQGPIQSLAVRGCLMQDAA